jgi:membrane protease YdiL (CAAX protease family)
VVAAIEGLSFLGVQALVAAHVEEMLAVMLSQLWTVVLIVAAGSLLGGRPRDVLALHGPAWGWRTYAAATMAMVLFRGLSALILVIVLAFVLSAGSFDLTADWQRDQGLVATTDLSLQIGVLLVGAPVSEELLYRGFLLSALAHTPLGFWGAALIATGLWTALHDYSAVGVIAVFTLGLFLSWLVWRTGSLRVAIYCHALNNALVLAAHHLAPLAIPG